MKKLVFLGLALAIGSLSCARQQPLSSETKPFKKWEAGTGPARPAITYVEDASTNTKVDPTAFNLTLVDLQGKKYDLKQYRGKKNIVLVVTRGSSSSIDRHDLNQVTRIKAKYNEIANHAEVLVVVPGPKDAVEQFAKRAARALEGDPVLFPILIDEQLAAVDKLGIRGDLAKPAVYILDKQGKVRFAYVGTTDEDRPSVDAILKQLDGVDKG
jgi:peroxiredoxin